MVQQFQGFGIAVLGLRLQGAERSTVTAGVQDSLGRRNGLQPKLRKQGYIGDHVGEYYSGY